MGTGAIPVTRMSFNKEERRSKSPRNCGGAPSRLRSLRAFVSSLSQDSVQPRNSRMPANLPEFPDGLLFHAETRRARRSNNKSCFCCSPRSPRPRVTELREPPDLHSARLAWPFCSLARRKDISDAMQCAAHSRNSRKNQVPWHHPNTKHSLGTSNPPFNLRAQHAERHSAVLQNTVMKHLDIELRAQFRFGHFAKAHDLERAEHV